MPNHDVGSKVRAARQELGMTSTELARAYSASGGDKQWLELAKDVWNRGSMRGYWTRRQDCPDDEVYRFAGHDDPKGDHVDIRSCMRLFYEVPRAK